MRRVPLASMTSKPFVDPFMISSYRARTTLKGDTPGGANEITRPAEDDFLHSAGKFKGAIYIPFEDCFPLLEERKPSLYNKYR